MSCARSLGLAVVVTLALGACDAPAPSAAASTDGATPAPSAVATVGPSISPTPGPTPAPAPLQTALQEPTVGSTRGHLTLTSTLTAAADPLAEAPVRVTIAALDSTYQVIELTGIVPAPAKSVIIGFRVNQEGAGPAPIDLGIYRITYSDGGRRKNRLPNAGFDSGLYHWAVYGTGRVTTPRSDRGDGRMLRLRASEMQDIAINSYGIGVTPKSRFRMTVAAKLPPAGTITGYASPIFIMDVELQRLTLDLVAPPIPALDLFTDVDGVVSLNQTLPAGRYLVRIEYAGDAIHEPTSLQQEVTVR